MLYALRDRRITFGPSGGTLGCPSITSPRAVTNQAPGARPIAEPRRVCDVAQFIYGWLGPAPDAASVAAERRRRSGAAFPERPDGDAHLPRLVGEIGRNAGAR